MKCTDQNPTEILLMLKQLEKNAKNDNPAESLAVHGSLSTPRFGPFDDAIERVEI